MRREMLLERAFEHRFWLKLSALIISGFGAFALFVYLSTGRDLGRSYGEAMYTIYTLKINIFSLLLASVYSVVIVILTVVFIALVAIFFSHKMAGPLYRFRLEFERLAGGDLTGKTSFRGRDQFALLAEEKNRMVGSLAGVVEGSRRDLEKLREASAVLLGQLKTIEGIPGSEDEEEAIRRSIRRLDGLVEQVRRGLQAVKTAKS